MNCFCFRFGKAKDGASRLDSNKVTDETDSPENEYRRVSDMEDDKAFLSEAKHLMEEPARGTAKAFRNCHKFIKHGRTGKPRNTELYLTLGHAGIAWKRSGWYIFHKKRYVDLSHIQGIEEWTNRERRASDAAQDMPLSGKSRFFRTFVGSNERRDASVEQIEARSFSIVTTTRTLDFVAPNTHVKTLWVRALKCMHQDRKNARGSVVQSNTVSDPFIAYLEEQWNYADTDRSGFMDQSELLELLKWINVTDNKRDTKKIFESFDDDKSKTWEKTEFTQYMEQLFSVRPEVSLIIQDIKKLAKKPVSEDWVTVDELLIFYNEIQAGFMTDLPPKPVTREEAAEEVRKFSSLASTRLSVRHFAALLDDMSNTVFDPKHQLEGVGQPLEKYMSHPLSHYFVNCSHNTYLVGDQLAGESSVAGYISSLLEGCRCVELDCWDGDQKPGQDPSEIEPVITHGNTLCTKILFRDAVQAIRDYAFKSSPYPVILSIELHASHRYQERMAAICEELLGEDIYVYDDQQPRLPSPEDLRYKFIIKGKIARKAKAKGGYHSNSALEPLPGSRRRTSQSSEAPAPPGAVPQRSPSPPTARRLSVDSNSSETSSMAPVGHKLPPLGSEEGEGPVGSGRPHHPAWVALIGLVGIHFHSLSAPGQVYNIFSLSESKANKCAASSRHELIRHNARNLTRVYPANTRVASTNLDPCPIWAAGCQLVAFNFQTTDLSMQLNRGKFLENGNLGYVLKPIYMRDTSIPPHSKEMLLTVTVLSAHRLPQIDPTDILDPHVAVELHGAGTDNRRVRTKTVMNNGFNPCWGKGRGEKFDFQIADPETAILRIAVADETWGGGQDFLGSFCVPVTCIRPGYRMSPLNDTKGRVLPHSGVLCCFQVSWRMTVV